MVFGAAYQLRHNLFTLRMNDLMEVLDKSRQVHTIFLDFEKARDRVSHANLILKVRFLLDNRKIAHWLDTYLTQRKQFVHTGNLDSAFVSVLSGAPQGSVLCPLLLLIYINDLQINSPVHCRLFADECVAYMHIQQDEGQQTLSSFSSALSNWFSVWQMDWVRSNELRVQMNYAQEDTTSWHLPHQQCSINCGWPI